MRSFIAVAEPREHVILMKGDEEVSDDIELWIPLWIPFDSEAH